MAGRIDWRERDGTTLADLYDGDWALLNAYVRESRSKRLLRDAVPIPHPLPGVRYADGVHHGVDAFGRWV